MGSGKAAADVKKSAEAAAAKVTVAMARSWLLRLRPHRRRGLMRWARPILEAAREGKEEEATEEAPADEAPAEEAAAEEALLIRRRQRSRRPRRSRKGYRRRAGQAALRGRKEAAAVVCFRGERKVLGGGGQDSSRRRLPSGSPAAGGGGAPRQLPGSAVGRTSFRRGGALRLALLPRPAVQRPERVGPGPALGGVRRGTDVRARRSGAQSSRVEAEQVPARFVAR